MKKQRNLFQTKEQDKTSEKDFSKMEMSDFPDKQLKITLTRILIEVRRTMPEESENFNKEVENIRKYQVEITELNNKITVLKYSGEGSITN